MPLSVDVDDHRLAEICRRYRVAKLELFGSRARGEGRPDSDIDLLVSFEEGYTPGLEFVSLADELESCLGHKVDLLTRSSIENSANPYRRRSILSITEPVYVTA